MKKIEQRHQLAHKQLGTSVVKVSSTFKDDAVSILANGNPILFGVKDTNQISKDLVGKLNKTNNFLFHTLDSMSDRGRAIDVALVNPLTARMMTGSSSGCCINVLYGINDFAVGTDGGGSVLAPAISTQLYSFLGKGMGLKGKYEKTSTDGLNFTPGIGIIAYEYCYIERVIKILCEDNQNLSERSKKLRIAVPKIGSITLPMGKDMTEMIYSTLGDFADECVIEEVEVTDLSDRYQAIPFMLHCFEMGFDMIMTVEGPIDVLGYGDTVMNEWGVTGKRLQTCSGKYLVKSANMINASALTIPIEELATGLVIVTSEGLDQGYRLLEFGRLLAEKNMRSQLYNKYFIHKSYSETSGFDGEV